MGLSALLGLDGQGNAKTFKAWTGHRTGSTFFVCMLNLKSKQESLSSLQNKLVCYLIENKPWLAVKTAEKLYEKYGADYIRKIDANCTLQMSATDLLHQFIDSLGEEIGMQKMLGYELGADTKAYISNQTVGPLINMISAEVEKTKKVDHKDPKARI